MALALCRSPIAETRSPHCFPNMELPKLLGHTLSKFLVAFSIDLRHIGIAMTKRDLCGFKPELSTDLGSTAMPQHPLDETKHCSNRFQSYFPHISV